MQLLLTHLLLALCLAALAWAIAVARAVLQQRRPADSRQPANCVGGHPPSRARHRRFEVNACNN